MSGAGAQAATHVYVGGVAGFDDLASPANSTLLRATGVVGLYMHADAMAAAYAAGQLPAISAAMSGTGPGEIELGINNVATGFFAGWWKLVCLDNGLHPDRANIDCDFAAPGFMDEWHAYVDAARAVGLATLAPIFSPNGPGASLDAFATNPGFASIRQAAVYGGALCIDAPPVFFAQRGQAYQTFTEQELAWATQQGLRTTVILSPYGDDATFLADTQTFVSRLAADHVVPTEWVVENYTPGDTDGIGSDTDASSMAGVALWVAQNAPVAVSASMATPATVVAMPASTPSSGAVTSDAAGMQYIVTPLAGSTAVASSGAATTIYSQGSDTIAAGSGFDIVYASGATTQVTGGAGRLLFVGGAGSATVSGGVGPCVMYADVGGGLYTAGTAGGSILVAGGPESTLTGAADGDVLFGAPLADGVVLEAGSGSEILVAGGGTTTLAGGSGTAVDFAGTGRDTFLVGGGSMDQIVGLKPTDTLTLPGTATVQSTQHGAWGTTLQLTDGTSVILFGVPGA